MPRVVHFDMSAEDPERAIQFYRAVFDWTFQKWEGAQEYWLITTGPEDEPGINGGLAARQEGPGQVITTIDVPSVDDFVNKIEEAGGTVTAPKMAIPGVGYLAYFQDTEGNSFGIIEANESAG
ncbi:MAG TPA: VOC family protein [Chloroflexota bacterium]|nr:VOC family protein [Chloroflexota bacterium]